MSCARALKLVFLMIVEALVSASAFASPAKIFYLSPDNFEIAHPLGAPELNISTVNGNLVMSLIFEASYRYTEAAILKESGGDPSSVQFIELPINPLNYHFFGELFENDPSVTKNLKIEYFPNQVHITALLSRDFTAQQLQSLFHISLVYGTLDGTIGCAPGSKESYCGRAIQSLPVVNSYRKGDSDVNKAHAQALALEEYLVLTTLKNRTIFGTNNIEISTGQALNAAIRSQFLSAGQCRPSLASFDSFLCKMIARFSRSFNFVYVLKTVGAAAFPKEVVSGNFDQYILGTALLSAAVDAVGASAVSVPPMLAPPPEPSDLPGPIVIPSDFPRFYDPPVFLPIEIHPALPH